MVNQLKDRVIVRTKVKNPELGKNIHDISYLSQTSKQVEAFKALILSAPEINAAKTAFIKEAIAEGRYTMHNEKIAAKLLAEVEMD